MVLKQSVRGQQKYQSSPMWSEGNHKSGFKAIRAEDKCSFKAISMEDKGGFEAISTIGQEWF